MHAGRIPPGQRRLKSNESKANSPRLRRNSLKAKKGISATHMMTATAAMPASVPPPRFGLACCQALSLQQADDDLLDDIGEDQQEPEHHRLVDNGKDERLAGEFLAEMERFGDMHDLRQNRGVDERSAVERIGQPVIRQHHELVQREQAEHDGKIEKHRAEMFELAQRDLGGAGAPRRLVATPLGCQRPCLARHPL